MTKQTSASIFCNKNQNQVQIIFNVLKNVSIFSILLLFASMSSHYNNSKIHKCVYFVILKLF